MAHLEQPEIPHAPGSIENLWFSNLQPLFPAPDQGAPDVPVDEGVPVHFM